MLAVIRVLILGLFIVFSFLFGVVLCIVRPFHVNNTKTLAHLYGMMSKIIGVEIEIRLPKEYSQDEAYVYVANHQNSYDLFTVSAAVQPRTVSIGKKSLKWIPFFGQMYWLAGNILIDRSNRSRAIKTLRAAAERIKHQKLSVWLFPEGTRSYGKGLLPFKTGAFHTAAQAEVPLIAVCTSTTHKKIKLNRFNNGKVIIELLKPYRMNAGDVANLKEVAQRFHQLMKEKIESLDRELDASPVKG